MNIQIRTIRLATLWRSTISNHALLLEIEMPALLVALLVCQGERKDCFCVLDGIIPFRSIRLQERVYCVEGDGGREGGYAEKAAVSQRVGQAK